MMVWWMMLASCVLIPLTEIIFGVLFYKGRPGKINSVFGYRTERSMKSPEAWEFAHRFSGRILFIIGLFSLIASIAAMIPFFSADENTVSIVGLIVLGVESILLVAAIIPTELALKRSFDDDGKRR